jgi:DNA polymerase/3'-5' exonuclease PolX
MLSGVIAKRENKNGRLTWGPENKLAVHIESGIPVDFFETDEPRWPNATFVRTGPAALNKKIASAALAMGWEWHAYGDGFTRQFPRDHRRVYSELEVFQHVELPYQEPWER